MFPPYSEALVAMAAATGAAPTAAAPSRLDEVWIRHRKSGVHQAFHVVDFRAFDVGQTIGVDDQTNPTEIDDSIVRRDFVVEAHAVANLPVGRLDEQSNGNPI